MTTSSKKRRPQGGRSLLFPLLSVTQNPGLVMDREGASLPPTSKHGKYYINRNVLGLLVWDMGVLRGTCYT